MSHETQLNAVILKIIRDRPGSTVTLRDLLDRLASVYARGNQQAFAGLYPSQLAASEQTNQDQEHFSEILTRLVVSRLEHLEKIGIVHLQRRSRLPAFLASGDLQIQLNRSFIELQRALGFSLSEIAQRNSKSLTIAPVFGSPKIRKNDVFVIMPFSQGMKEVYSAIVDCCRSFDLSVKRGDDIFGVSHVIEDVWSCIYSSNIIVCDCTGKNANVFYELGIAHTLGKEVLLITRDETDVPFDLRHWRYITYSSDLQALADKLATAIRAIGAGKSR
jgi:hypothetical protein